MKSLILAFFSLFFLYTANAQSYYLEAGNRYVGIKEDGSFYLGTQPSSQVYLGLDNRIYTKDHNLYFKTDYQQNRKIRFIPSEAEADKLILEEHFLDNGQYITKGFFEGTLYLSVVENQLVWRKRSDEAVPILLKSPYYVEAAMKERRREDAAIEAARKLQQAQAAKAAEKKRQQDAIAAAEKKRKEAAALAEVEARQRQAIAAAKAAALKQQQQQQQQPLTNGTITVILANFKGNRSDYFAELISADNPKISGKRQEFNARGGKAVFTGLGKGDYKVNLYKRFKNHYSGDMFIDSSLCDGCGSQNISSKNKVTLSLRDPAGSAKFVFN